MNEQELFAQPEQQAPAIIGSNTIPGLEDIDADDIRIPRIKLLQGSSKEVKSPDDFPDLRVGMIINTQTHQPLHSLEVDGKKVYPFIAVKMFKSWLRFNAQRKDDPDFDPDYEPGKLIFKTYDRKDPITGHKDAWKWKQINFLGFQPNNPRIPMFINFASSSRKCGDDIINIVQASERPLWESLFYLSNRAEEKNGNSYQVYSVRLAGKPDDSLIQIGRQMHSEFAPMLADMKRASSALDDGEDTTPARPY